MARNILRFVRGTKAQNLNYTGAVGEPTMASDTGEFFIHDGSTKGGAKLVRAIDASRVRLTDLAERIGLRLAGDGVTLEGDVLQQTLAYAAANGMRVTGAGRTFASAGTVRFYKGLDVEDLSVTADSTSLGSGRLLFGTDMGADGSVRIYRSRIRVTGNASIGSMNDSMGLHLNGGARHVVEDLDVSVVGKRSMIAVTYVNDSDFVRLFAHDGLYDDPAVIDDCIQGIWFYGTVGCRMIAPKVDGIYGNGGLRSGMALPPGLGSTAGSSLWTRGISGGFNRDLSITDPFVRRVDQGIDITGSAGNINVKIQGGTIIDCETHGAKFANTAYRCSITGTAIERAGRCAVAVSEPVGPVDGIDVMASSEVICTDVMARDTGTRRNRSDGTDTASFYAAGGSDVIPFRIESNSGGFPRGVTFDGCRNLDTKGRTLRGFQNDVPYLIGSGQLNRITPTCTSVGHTDAASTGFHENVVELQALPAGNLNVANAASPAIDWGVEISDTMGLHAPASNSDIVKLEPGVWRSEAAVLWPANPAGTRSILVSLNGNAVDGTLSQVSGEGSLKHQAVAQFVVPPGPPANARLQVSQNSGSTLSLPQSQITWRLTRVR